EVSRVSTGKIQLHREAVELRDVVARAVETSQPHFDSGGQLLTVQLPREPVRLVADPTRLAQVLSNLLNNAAKYSEPGGAVSRGARREDSAVVIRVRDQGVGIPQEMLPHVFDLFTQVDRSLNRAQGGLGIGLSLVRSLVQMHDGSVTAASAGPG